MEPPHPRDVTTEVLAEISRAKPRWSLQEVELAGTLALAGQRNGDGGLLYDMNRIQPDVQAAANSYTPHPAPTPAPAPVPVPTQEPEPQPPAPAPEPEPARVVDEGGDDESHTLRRSILKFIADNDLSEDEAGTVARLHTLSVGKLTRYQTSLQEKVLVREQAAEYILYFTAGTRAVEYAVHSFLPDVVPNKFLGEFRKNTGEFARPLENVLRQRFDNVALTPEAELMLLVVRRARRAASEVASTLWKRAKNSTNGTRFQKHPWEHTTTAESAAAIATEQEAPNLDVLRNVGAVAEEWGVPTATPARSDHLRMVAAEDRVKVLERLLEEAANRRPLPPPPAPSTAREVPPV